MLKKIIVIVCIIGICSLMFCAALADIEDVLNLSAQSVLMMDAQNGYIIYEKNPYEKMPVASITKIMTLYIAFKEIEEGRLSLDDIINVSYNAKAMGGSQVYLETNGNYLLNNILKSIVVASANDSCVALAEHISGSEEAFIQKMNDTANELGLENTLFENCTGLPAPNHYMCAYDIAKLSQKLLECELFFTYSTIWTQDFAHPSGRTTMMTNTNKLVRNYTGYDGIKTGFTNEAMFCLSSSAKRGDTRLIAVVLGEPTSKVRNNDIASLLNYGFANYMTYKIYNQDDVIEKDIHIYGAKDYIVNAICSQDASIFIKKESQNQITSSIRIDEKLQAPIMKGERIGEIDIFVDLKSTKTIPIIANRDIEKASYFDCLSYVVNLYSRS